jgi:hypothetical protein
MPPEKASRKDAPAPSAHAAIKIELLVRYLDTWLPAALHGHKRVTYVDSSTDSAHAAAKVVAEFEDVLHRHTVTLISPAIDLDPADVPAGLTLAPLAGTHLAALRSHRALGSPIFAWLSAPVPDELLSTVARNKGTEVTLCGTDVAAAARSLRDEGLPRQVRVDLVDKAGVAEQLVFATSSERALEKFKDELWALDEYGGIRLRDPTDSDGTLLDISVQPQLGPLRRALVTRVGETGGSTLAELRTWAVHETIFRSADATRAVQAVVAAGLAARTPHSGRLAPDTLIHPVSTDVQSDVDE